MVTPTIAHRLEGEWQVLSIQGQPILPSHDRLIALLRVHIGQDTARLLAKPILDDGGQPIAWASPRSGSLQPVPDGPSDLRTLFERRRKEILELADRLAQQGEAGQEVARSLRAALITPTGVNGLFADGGEPVLVYWGLIRPGQAVDLGLEAQAFPSAAAVGEGLGKTGAEASAPAGPIQAASPANGPGASQGNGRDAEERGDRKAEGKLGEGKAGGVGRRFAWFPALLTLLLLGVALWLVLRVLTPLEPVIVEIQREVPADAPGDAQGSDATMSALEAELARLDQSIAGARLAENKAQTACLVPQRDAEPLPEPSPGEVVPPKANPVPPVQGAEVPKVDPPPQDEPPVGPAAPAPPPEKPEGPKTIVQAPKASAPSSPAPTPSPPPNPSASACQPSWSPGREPRMVFVVDGSGSMREGISGAPSRLDAAKRSIRETVDSLHPDIKAGLVSFSDCNDTKNSEFYAYSQRPTLMSKIDGMQPGRSTSLAASIRRGGLLATRRSETVIMVVSDGEDTCGGDPCAAARQVKAEKPKAIIHVIDLSGGGDGGVARCIASAGGGRVFKPNTAAQVTQQLRSATGQPDTRGCR
ncbi:VWA domain-containing protein [Rhodospirillum sp. A1_3_36]|uniref:VWA domain-containing protein n=1 Tax=Rhodospirillum sp. A1_3_36 TaxID=3391666 RepID=UPI0039A4E9D4